VELESGGDKTGILAVDDDLASLAMVEAVLAPIAHVTTVASGEDALNAASVREFAAILLDVGLPRIDGFETARRLRARPGTRHVPIIFLTGHIGEEQVRRGYELGAADYLLKPFDPQILAAKVQVFVDLARLRSETAILTHRSLHDPLTGLPNRTLFLDRLERAIARLARHPALLGVVFFDLDGFKAINDRLGHAAGDEVLVEVATRIQAKIRATDTAARFAGDEFLVLLEDMHEEHQIELLVGRLDAALGEPYAAAGRERVTATAGLTVTDDPDTTAEALIALADERMLRNKARRRVLPRSRLRRAVR
jgi:diguanylate cyclase (GGDEF)-like protein